MFERGTAVGWSWLSIVAGLVLVFAFAASSAFAQSGTSGTIAGTVRDESGGALPGVTATLTREAAGRPRIGSRPWSPPPQPATSAVTISPTEQSRVRE